MAKKPKPPEFENPKPEPSKKTPSGDPAPVPDTTKHPLPPPKPVIPFKTGSDYTPGPLPPDTPKVNASSRTQAVNQRLGAAEQAAKEGNYAAAVAYAMQICDTPRMVTVSIDKCIFEKPSKEGQIIKIFGWPSAMGTTSVTFYIEARAHNVRTGSQYVVLKTHTKFVYIDEDGNPLPLKDKSRARIEKMLGDKK